MKQRTIHRSTLKNILQSISSGGGVNVTFVDNSHCKTFLKRVGALKLLFAAQTDKQCPCLRRVGCKVMRWSRTQSARRVLHCISRILHVALLIAEHWDSQQSTFTKCALSRNQGCAGRRFFQRGGVGRGEDENPGGGVGQR